MRIAVDVKNLSLFGGGIAQFFAPLLSAWISHRPNDEFLLVGPEFDKTFLGDPRNCRHVRVAWPNWLPRPLRHPYYDNVLFPRGLRQAHADFVFSPYHDVRLNGRAITVMMIHDTCLEELVTTYPRRIRWYYLAMLRHNLRCADHVLTVSQASRRKIIELYGVAADRVHVAYNACHPELIAAELDVQTIHALRARYPGQRLLLYPGGSEHRKNVSGLLEAFSILVVTEPDTWVLLVTGTEDANWTRILNQCDARVVRHVIFLGRLDYKLLKEHYCAVDAAVYPTLCEGFGRVCLESMATGAPLACSDLPVLREVAGEYPQYFDPHNPTQIAAAIRRAVAAGRTTPVHDERFNLAAIQQSFLTLMDRLMAMAVRTSA
jgi:glycosyltransferase involved in cell wall biosynthesis